MEIIFKKLIKNGISDDKYLIRSRFASVYVNKSKLSFMDFMVPHSCTWLVSIDAKKKIDAIESTWE